MTDISLVRGETLDVEIEVVDGDGASVDLTGYAVVMRLSSGKEYSTAAGTITTVGNLARLRIAPADTLALSNRHAVYGYEAKVMSPAGVIKSVLDGKVVVGETLIEEIGA